MWHQGPNLFALFYAANFGLILCVMGVTWSRHIDGKILKRANG
jgi:hypothetical protein